MLRLMNMDSALERWESPAPLEADGYVLRLLPARPEAYLLWMAYWREVESKMVESPGLEEMASSEAAPFLHGSIALQLSDVVRQITQQATSALARARGLVVPQVWLTGSVELLAEMASYVQQRGAWLTEHAGPVGIEPPTPEVRQLRLSTIQYLRTESVRLMSDGRVTAG
jgi:hypothetical protein